MHNIFLPLFSFSLISFLCGLLSGNNVKKAPELFWRNLLVGLIISSPFMIKGHTWFDEIYLLGFFIPIMLNNFKRDFVRRSLSFKELSHDDLLTIALIFLLIIDAIRGVIYFLKFGYYPGLSKIRWVFFWGLLLLVFISAKEIKANFSDAIVARSVVKSGLFLILLYFSFAIFSVLTTHNPNNIQAADLIRGNFSLIAIWGSSAYVTIIFIIIAAFGYSLLFSNEKKDILISLIFITISCFVFFYVRSRGGVIGLFIIHSFYLFTTIKEKNSRYIRIFLTFVLVTLTIFKNPIEGNFYHTYDLPETTSNYSNGHFGRTIQEIEILRKRFLKNLPTHEVFLLMTNPAKDFDRKVRIKSSILAMDSGNDFNKLFGYGMRTSGYIVAPISYALFTSAGISVPWKEDIATEGFTEILIDTGIIGTILIALLAFRSSLAAFKIKRTNLFFLILPCILAGQFFIINCIDIFLMYLFFIPTIYKRIIS